MSLTRRAFIKQTAAASAASVAGIVLPGVSGALAASDLTWSKAPCRFCGTGCGVSVGV
jgi:nitrate reductase NapA